MELIKTTITFALMFSLCATVINAASPLKISRSGMCPLWSKKDIPDRKHHQKEAKDIMQEVAKISGEKRDLIFEREILAGNMPEFTKNLVPVTIVGEVKNGVDYKLTICVIPDYLSIGSFKDSVRISLGKGAAMRIAESFSMILPTPKIVDVIYKLADRKLTPIPMSPGPAMTSTKYLEIHNDKIEKQLQKEQAASSMLIAGHKKDVIGASKKNKKNRVAIYGWHQKNGKPIQNLSTVHHKNYSDYSHGIRLVSKKAVLNGELIDLQKFITENPNAF
jgi:hypothetical protein